ncbi:phage regulatory protein/antirepressor Ant [Paenibacillus naphthalenovorans]|uniref:phage regulatory protein/antirepressor Ant n=1 Tax=Paenibacillus naphthalenovorans TaxID=162209 RepID=UPI003D291E26
MMKVTESNLVFVTNGNEIFTDSLRIAEGTYNEHESVQRLIRNYIDKLQQIGTVGFEIRGNGFKIYHLTEPQATFLISLMKNNDIVVDFKLKLTQEFYRMREYIQNQIQPRLPSNYKEALLALVQAEEEKEKLQAEKLMLEQVVAEAKPKLTYLDKILSAKNAITITQIAKDYGMSAQRMNEFLHEHGIQFKQSGQWLLYAKYADQGYTKSETYPYTDKYGEQQTKLNTKWTQKGRIFLYEFLKKHNILPLMDTVQSEFINKIRE